MKCLSIRQPWAHLIIHGGKDIENRTWKTKHRGPFLIHAAQIIDYEACRKFNLKPNQLHTGGIIGVVDLVDVVTESKSKWWIGPIGFVLENPKELEYRVYKGKLNFFEAEYN